MSDFKVSSELRKSILTFIYEGDWYVHSSKYGHDLDINEMYIENADKVADSIVDEVMSFLSTKDLQTYQMKRIADSLEKISKSVGGAGLTMAP
jgi:predicted transcriptional regulator